jgi:hypothetical protein
MTIIEDMIMITTENIKNMITEIMETDMETEEEMGMEMDMIEINHIFV